MVGKCRDTREVIYISDQFAKDMVEVQNKRNEIKSKPLAIVNYNKCMSGVDRHDQMLSYYLSERKTIRWYKKLFIHVVKKDPLFHANRFADSITQNDFLLILRAYCGKTRTNSWNKRNTKKEVQIMRQVSDNEHTRIMIARIVPIKQGIV